jgi:uncharacterized protein (DUF362 family)
MSLGMSSVSFVRIQGNSIASIRQAIEQSLDLIDFSFMPGIARVVIKPNLCYYWDYSTGATTDPRFVAALIEAIRQRAPSKPAISIVESDASAMKCKYAFRMLGFEKLSRDYGVKLINLSEDEYEVVKTRVGRHTFNLRVPRTIHDADLRINVPKIKYSIEKIQITCALKNIFGCNPYPKKYKFHPKLEEVIVATNEVMKFGLCLVDANIVAGIGTCRLGLVMASTDAVATDSAASRIAGLNPNSIKYLQLAHREGLGNTKFVSKGALPDYFISRFPRKDGQKVLMNKAYNLLVATGLDKRLGLE